MTQIVEPFLDEIRADIKELHTLQKDQKRQSRTLKHRYELAGLLERQLCGSRDTVPLDRSRALDQNQCVAPQSSSNQKCARCASRYILDIDPTENGDLLLCGNCGHSWCPRTPTALEPAGRRPIDRYIDQRPLGDR